MRNLAGVSQLIRSHGEQLRATRNHIARVNIAENAVNIRNDPLTIQEELMSDLAAAAKIAPRFGQGESVRVAGREALGHCRTPWYLRGRSGVVVAVQGMFHDPERLAYHKPGLPRIVLYTVRFRLCDVWADYKGSMHDQL